MLETHLNLFDIAVIGVMVLSCLFAFFRGLVREILSLVAWVGAAIVTACYFQQFSETLEPHFRSPHIAAAAAGLILYIGALMGFSIVNMMIIKTIKSGEEAGMLDNMLGLFFGAFRGAFILSLAFFLITIVVPDENKYPEWLAKAKTLPYVKKGSAVLTSVAPEYMHKLSNLQKGIAERTEEQGNAPSAGGTSYNQNANRQLERLIDSTDRQ